MIDPAQIQMPDGQTLVFRLASPAASQGLGDVARLQEAVSGMVNAIGIRSTVVNLDFNRDYVGSGRGVRSGYYDKDTVVIVSAPPNSEADEDLFAYLHSRSTTNIEHLNDPVYDAMIDRQRTLVDEDERLKAVLEIQRYIAEKLYAVGTVGASAFWELVQPRVRNYSYSDSRGLYTENYAKVWLSS